MKESDYIKLTNRLKIIMAKSILSEVLPGDEYGISDSDYKIVISILLEVEMKLFKMEIIEVEE